MREKDGVVLQEAAGGSIASLHGELDLHSMPEFERRLADALVEGEGYLAVDLSALGFIDSQGIHMLSRIRDMALELDRRFYVVCEGGACRRVLDAVGADNIFNLKSSRQELESANG